MDEARLVRTSKFLSLHLRHQPERLGLSLLPGGWVPVDDLLAACARRGFSLSRAELEEVVERNNKRRFSFDGTGTLIRANQGHSVAVDLQYEAVTPPDVLYHGTADHFLAVILRQGLKKMRRHHVHLAEDLETAIAVGRRHGRPAVLAVDAAAMQRDGHLFYRSENGVWLTDHVAPRYFRVLRGDELPPAGR